MSIRCIAKMRDRSAMEIFIYQSCFWVNIYEFSRSINLKIEIKLHFQTSLTEMGRKLIFTCNILRFSRNFGKMKLVTFVPFVCIIDSTGYVLHNNHNHMFFVAFFLRSPHLLSDNFGEKYIHTQLSTMNAIFNVNTNILSRN